MRKCLHSFFPDNIFRILSLRLAFGDAHTTMANYLMEIMERLTLAHSCREFVLWMYGLMHLGRTSRWRKHVAWGIVYLMVDEEAAGRARSQG